MPDTQEKPYLEAVAGLLAEIESQRESGAPYFVQLARLLSLLFERYRIVSPWRHAAEAGINPNTLVGAVRRGSVPGGVEVGRGWLMSADVVQWAIDNGRLFGDRWKVHGGRKQKPPPPPDEA